MQKILLLFISIIACLLLPQHTLGQEASPPQIKIESVQPNELKKTIDLSFSIDNKGVPFSVNAPDLLITETYNGQKDTANIELIQSDHQGQEFLFLIDKTGNKEYVEPILTAIKKSLQSNRLPKESYQEALYFEEASEVIDLLKSKQEEQIVFLFADAQGAFAKNNLKESSKIKLQNAFKNFNPNTHFFPLFIAESGTQTFLNELVNLSPSTQDQFKQILPSPISLQNSLKDFQKLFFNRYLVEITPPNPIYRGEKRSLDIQWKKEPKLIASIDYGQDWATGNNELDLNKVPPPNIHNWLNWWFIGAIVISAILAFFSILIPLIKQYNFKQKYVSAYAKVKPQGVVKRDPLTGDPFEDEDLVVTKCEHMTSLSSWEYNKNQCLYYPDTCNSGVANLDSSKFFSQEGINRYLNWLWFGSLGGFIAWTLIALLKNLELGFIDSISHSLLDLFDLSSDYLSAFGNEWLTALALGLGLTFGLAWVEERGQSSQLSWLRIIGKSLLGAILAFAAFVIGYVLLKKFNLTPFVGGIVSWILLGVFLGSILSFKSSVELKRGILGGMLAGVIAFSIYYFLSDYWDSSELRRMFSFLLFGGVMGFILVSIIKGLEDFELEYIAPEKFRRINPISKWLKAGIDVFIGSDASCYVFVKWSDPSVQAKHAKLSFDGNHVYMEPMAETWVNNRILPLHSKTPLKDRDIIKFGANSITRLQFREKRKAVSTSPRAAVPQAQVSSVPPQIKIRKK